MGREGGGKRRGGGSDAAPLKGDSKFFETAGYAFLGRVITHAESGADGAEILVVEKAQ